MHEDLLTWLACPDCGGDVALENARRTGTEIVSGQLACAGCGTSYPILGGVPRMNRAMDGLENVVRTFDFEWKAHHAGELEEDTLFGRTRDEDWEMFQAGTRVDPAQLEGKVVLDAGCGSGSFTTLIRERGAATVIGVDIIDAVDDAYRSCRDLEHVHIVQANLFKLPFKKHAFDLIWSNGVIHHTPDAAGAHRSLAEHVKAGGIFYVWVYAKRFNPFRFTKTVLDAVRITRLPEPVLLAFSKAISYPSVALLSLYRLVRALPGLRPRTAWGHRTVRPRSVKEVQLTWFDALSPEYDTRHSEQEVIGWFESQGFRDILAIEEPKVGVRGVAPHVNVAEEN